MKYYSTNKQAPVASLQEAVVKGLAADKGDVYKRQGYGRYGGSRVSALMYSVMECHLLRGKWGITNRDSPQSGGFQRFDQ